MILRVALAGALIVVLAAGAIVILSDRANQYGGPPAGEATPSGEVAVAYPDDPPSLNPYSYDGDTNATRDLLRPVFPTLLSIGPDLRYLQGVAIRVPAGRDITENPFTVTFRLDPNAVWSDGTPLSSDDVRFTWETIRNRDLPIADRRPYLRVVDVATPDAHTVKLVFDRPYPAWRDLFSAGDFLMPKHALEGKDLSTGWDQVPGAGPFVIERYEPGLKIVYSANPRWWGRGPGLRRVTVFIVPAIETSLRLLDQNRVQVVVATTQLNLERRLEKRSGVRSASRFGSSWWELAFNHQRPGPNEPGFRRAVGTGIDRHGIVEALVRTEGRLLQDLAPGRRAAPAFATYRLDRQASHSALSEAGFGESAGKFRKAGVDTIGISAPEESEIAQMVGRSIYQGLVDSGIDAEIRNPRGSLLYGKWRNEGRFDLALWERRGTSFHSFASHFRSTALPPEGINYYRLSSAEIDKALDAAEAGSGYQPLPVNELMKRLSEALPSLPIFEAKAYAGFRSSVRGPDPNATIDGPFWNLERWRLSG